jgi:uncharacterized membrane protein
MLEIFLWTIGIVIFFIILAVVFVAGMVTGVVMYYSDQEAMGEVGYNKVDDRQMKGVGVNTII